MTLINRSRTVALSRWLLIGLATAVAAAVFFAWLSDEVLEGDTLNLDETVRELVNRYASAQLTAAMQTITILGSVAFLLVFGAMVGLVLVVKKWRRELFLFSATMLGASILNVSLKAIFRRTRPGPLFGTPLPSSFSFPSGHALLSLCFYCILAYLVTFRCSNPIVVSSVWTAAVLLALAIGISRIYLGVHYPSDVIAGYAASICWIIAIILGDRLLLQRPGNK